MESLVILVAGVLGVLLVCCIGVAALAPNLRRIIQAPFWKTDAQLAAQAAHKMLDYDLPPDYQESQVLNIQGQGAAVIIAHRVWPEDMIFIEYVQEVLSPTTSGEPAMRPDLARNGPAPLQHAAGRHATNDDSRQPTTLRLFEGTDENSRKIRQVVCGFSGKSGDVLLAIVAGQETWDQAMIDGFLQSVR